MTALKAPARAPKIQFSHFGINVRDLEQMEDFYTRVVGFTVTDRGVGIDPRERRTIFEKFVRGSAAAAGRSSGTGLGLAMVDHIVRAHGGEIDVAVNTYGGSIFTIRLPLEDLP